MMKKSFLLSFALLPLSLFLTAEEKITSDHKTLERSHLKMVEEVLNDYESGYYNVFLSRSDQEFQKKQEEWKYNTLLEERKKLSTALGGMAPQKNDTFKKKISLLLESQDQELLEIALTYPDEKLSREVRDMILFCLSEEEQKSLDFIHDLSLKSKGEGQSPIENKLIAIDTEFWIKALSLEISKTQKKIDDETFQKQLLVLQLEKINQMKKACEETTNGLTKACIEKAFNVFPKVYSTAATRKYLDSLKNGKITPKTLLEKKFKEVMDKYSQKEKELVKDHFQKENN